MIAKISLFVALAIVAVSASYVPVHHEIHHHAPQPYKFGYTIKDKHGEQYREESGDGHSGVRGSYGFTDARGIHRRVDYVADKGGFRAQVKTNEPGTANQDPAAVNIISSADSYSGAGFGGIGYGVGGAGLGIPAGYGGIGYGAGVVNQYDSRYGIY